MLVLVLVLILVLVLVLVLVFDQPKTTPHPRPHNVIPPPKTNNKLLLFFGWNSIRWHLEIIEYHEIACRNPWIPAECVRQTLNILKWFSNFVECYEVKFLEIHQVEFADLRKLQGGIEKLKCVLQKCRTKHIQSYFHRIHQIHLQDMLVTLIFADALYRQRRYH